MNKIALSLGIIFLFILSAVSPISFGYNAKIPVNTQKMKCLYPPYPFEDPPNLIWIKPFEGGGKYCQQTIDNGYIILGQISAPGPFNCDILLIKTDIDGNELWNKTYGEPYEDIGHRVRLTSDGGFILTGYYSHAQGGPYDVVLIKTDKNGNMTWEKRFNRGPEQTTFGGSVIVLDDGYLIMSDVTYPGVTHDIWLIKTDFDGNEIWNKTVGGAMVMIFLMSLFRLVKVIF